MDWRNFLCGPSGGKLMVQKAPYEEQVKWTAKALAEADGVLVGGGAGLSAAAGLTYGGKRFTDNFPEFIERYGADMMPDMYAAGFYPFATEEERWGYWSKHACLNRVWPEALPLYRKLFDLAVPEDYFVLTTNVDHQFWKAGFDGSRMFATQGDYGRIQCARGCHPKTYDAVSLFQEMDAARRDCKIPHDLVPRCPVCGGPMAMNLRCDPYFVEDEAWQESADRYGAYLKRMEGKRLVLLELGVGFNTPGIIKYPFWQMTARNPAATYVCINQGQAFCPEEIEEQSVCMDRDIGAVLDRLLQGV